MDQNEFNEILEWIGENVNDLPFEDQLVVILAATEMVKNVKPIFLKHKAAANEPTTFLYKM